ncbi:metabotropic glutamate receptor 8 isoform X2 [Condylostylus longicornis]|uniref:metabotropic glutamate receptor 8 isoform X2 n=1 Tax=Condylostylus longicornis TaxID=2530218 RepID=UPI00244DFEE6|nr:metabotropic glutamate receptor 8 isoform X2 [Condylostylus longicornis]
MIFMLIILKFNAQFVNCDNLDHEGKIIRTSGDIILGGIFPMHEHDANNKEYPCGAIKEEKGVQRLEAMLYAIDLINNDSNILPNITLGALIIDSCSSDTYALEQSMEFVRYYMNQDMSEYVCENGKPPLFKPHKPVSGVIGASFSVVSIMVANILRLFKIPQISYASTSTELSDKSRFEYFSRVVPPDNFQAQAMAEIVQALEWHYVNTVAVEGDYGEKGIASFVQIAATVGICVAVSEKVARNAKSEDFDKIIENLSHNSKARAVIMFVDEDNIRKLLHATIRANKVGYFYWIGSDSWGAKVYPVREQEIAAVNAITILPQRTNLKGFDEYYLSLRPKMNQESCSNSGVSRNQPALVDKDTWINCRNIWFNEFWSQHNKCGFDKNSTRICSGLEKLIGYEQEGLVPFVVDAVYAMAYAVHNFLVDICGDSAFNQCEVFKPEATGYNLLRYIRKVSFVGQQGNTIRFNEDGDAYGFYNIYQYQQTGDSKYDYVQIGRWKQELDLDISTMRWKGPVPRLVCSEPCPIGHVRNHQDQCCWSCVRCREDAYVKNDTCETCKPGWAPDTNRTSCFKLKPEVIDWMSPWALVPICFSGIGIFCTFFTVSVFIAYNRTPVIMASGRELCYVLLCGILCCYCTTFIILAPPSVIHCTLLRISLGLGLSICYSAIFIKTNRISRIFNNGVKSVKRPGYISPKSQIWFSVVLVSIQLLGSIVWSFIEIPDVKEIHPYPLTAVLTCKVSSFSLALSLIYNIILIALCTIYAFKTRKIPENFNEAKYIGFTMYSTCIVWLAFLPIYFGTRNDYQIQISSLCMCLNISATAVLTCLLAPKVFLVLFQPYKNLGHRDKSRTGDSSAPIRFLRQTQSQHSQQQAISLQQIPTTQHSSTTVSPSSPGPSAMEERRLTGDEPVSTISMSVETALNS